MTDFKYVTEQNFDALLHENEKPTMVYFWTTWSSACKKEEPILDKIMQKFKDSANFFAVNIEECPNLKQKYGITVLPTVVFFKSGAITAKETGNQSEVIYLSHISRLLES